METTFAVWPSGKWSPSQPLDCLSLHSRERNWVASGSFDRTIKLWDISRPASTTSNDALVTLVPPEDATNAAASSNPKGSIYALAADYFGRMVACGSPERVVRLWDPRSGKRIGTCRSVIFINMSVEVNNFGSQIGRSYG